jgi:hypothetical protein
VQIGLLGGMSNTSLIERYGDKIAGVLGCFDRLVITGSLPDCCHVDAMKAQLLKRKIMFFDYSKLVDPLRNRLHTNAQTLAEGAGVQVEAIRSFKGFRKEDRIAGILEKRGTHPGLVHVFSAMENCNCFKPWHDRATGRTYLKASGGRCAHLYFYFIDELLGLCYLRVPTWAPFRLQFYCNGHNWLAGRLRREKIAFTQQDNAIVAVDDFARAQALADDLDPLVLHKRLDRWAEQFCPVHDVFASGWHWSLMQIEYATDIVFKRPNDLAPLYETLTRRAIQEVKADDIATFLGRNGLSPLFEGEGGSRYNVLIEGTRLRHNLGGTSIKMYDKFQHVLRIETTTNDVSFFKHYRQVVHRDGRMEMKNAPVQKTIHSLGVVREVLAAANRRYLDFLSILKDDSSGRRDLDRVSRSVQDDAGRSYRGINFFLPADLNLALALVRGEYLISGVNARRLRKRLQGWSGSQVSRAIRRFRELGLLKKIGGTFKYYITKLGQKVIATALRLRETDIITTMSSPVPA